VEQLPLVFVDSLHLHSLGFCVQGQGFRVKGLEFRV